MSTAKKPSPQADAAELSEQAAEAGKSMADAAKEELQAAGDRARDTAHDAATAARDEFDRHATAVRDYLSSDLDVIRRDVTEFARKNPLVFFGGAAALGFVAGRMLKSSDPGRDKRGDRHATRTDPYDANGPV